MRPGREPIAIIGIGCRFPGGASGAEGLWRLLVNAEDAIIDVPPARWDHRLFYDPDPTVPGRTHVRQAGFLREPIDQFDAEFFGLSPREAEIMDPQQRLMLEVTWEALEDAGIPSVALRGSDTGVYVGGFCLDNLLQRFGPLSRDGITPQTAASSTMVMLSNRLSYTFDLRGPSLTTDTACSASLTAFHLACQALWNGECSLALAGGVNVFSRPEHFIVFSKAGFLAPDGRCKAFDERADGYARGEGAGVVVLKPLSRALEDGDLIYALVEATGINQDGRTQGISAPNPDAQRALLAQVYADAGVSPGRVRYLEAHGTGTQAGDTVEVGVLGELLGRDRPPDDPCWLGSIKTNIGHLEAAAGIAGIIKAALVIHHRQVPPSLHFERPNPKINFAKLPLRVALENVSIDDGRPLWIGINSFGYGGSNAHALLRDHKPPARAVAAERPALCPLVVSAGSERALRQQAKRLADYLEASPELDLTDVGRACALRRTHLAHRAVVTAETSAEAVAAFQELAEGRTPPRAMVGRNSTSTRGRVVFVYTGMGAQWWGMGAELARSEPVFAKALEACSRALVSVGGHDLLDVMGWAGGPPQGEEEQPISAPIHAQPANLAIQIALTKLWESRGVTADAIVGHSVGEIAAAWGAGLLDLDDAMRLTWHRCQLQQALAGSSSMLTVGASMSVVAPLLDDLGGQVCVAAFNSAGSLTLAGPNEALATLASRLAVRNVFHRNLKVDVAYHSPQMDAMREALLETASRLRHHPIQRPLYSTVTGARIRDGAHSATYWWRNVRDPVRLSDAVSALGADEYDTFLEVGPHPVLAHSIHETLTNGLARTSCFASLQRGRPERTTMEESLYDLYLHGAYDGWKALLGDGPRRRLPTYAWAREPIFTETSAAHRDKHGTHEHPLLHVRSATSQPTWRSTIGGVQVPYVSDHWVDGQILVPGALFAELALAVAAATGRSGWIRDLTFHKVLVGSRARVEASVVERDGWFEIHSADEADDTRWLLHVTGRIGKAPPPPGMPRDLDALARRLPRSVSRQAIYAALRARGLEHGPRFQTIRSVRAGAGEVVAELELSPEVDPEGYHVHPTLLDGAFQALIAALGSGGAAVPMVPVSIREMRCYAPVGSRGRVWVRVTSSDATTLEANLCLYGDDGAPRIEVIGLRCASLPSRSPDRDLDRHLYHHIWEEKARDGEPAPATGTWLLLADRHGFIKALASRLVDKGARVIVVTQEELAGRGGMIDTWIQREGPFAALVFGWALDPIPEDEDDGLAAIGQPAAIALLSFVQSHCRHSAGDRLVLLTRGLFAPDGAGSAAPEPPSGAATWGLARVIAQEHPELMPLRIDVDAHAGNDTLDALAAELLTESRDDEVALRGQRRYVHRLVRSPLDETSPVLPTDVSVPAVLDYTTPGGINTLRWYETRRRAPGPGEVEIAVKACPLNFKDILKLMGMLDARYSRETATGLHLGLECAGVVVRVGEGVKGLRVGDAVVSVIEQGSFRTFATVSARFMAPLPTGWSFAQSVNLINYITAYYGLHVIGQLEPGERVLIHCATGGVGLAAVFVARWKGAEILATAGSEEKRAYLRELGVREVMDSRSLAFVDQVRASTQGEGVDVVLNSLSGDALDASLDLLARYGRFIEIGKRDILADHPIGMGFLARQATITSIDLDQLLLERTEHYRRLVDAVRTLMGNRTLPPLPTTTFAPEQTVEAFQHLARARHIGKVVIDLSAGPVPVRRGHIREATVTSDGTYLVAGGLGGFGLEVARWLADQGARHLVLVGRSVHSRPEAEALAVDLGERGVAVEFRAVDVSDEASVAALVAGLGAAGRLLRGVFHTAMVLDDGPLSQLSAARFARVMAPKALGAWNLHRATLGQPLDFFVLFSSISAAIGNAGQGNYVAANAFLDTLAEWRRRQGLPGLSIGWGVLQEAGVVSSKPEMVRHLARQGLIGFTNADALAVLGRLVALGAPTKIAAVVDWTAWAKSSRGMFWSPRFERVVMEHGEDIGASQAPRLRDDLREIADVERIPFLAQRLIGAFADVLRMEAVRVSSDQSLDKLGVDSLTVVELAARVEALTGAKVQPMSLLGGQSIARIAAGLLPGMLSEAAPPVEIAAAVGAEIVDDMTEPELDALLAELSGIEGETP